MSPDFDDVALFRPGARLALVVGHPGHELMVHGWLARMRPVVHILTDGSGATGRSRLSSSERLLDRAGARPGRIFGALPDAALYASLLRGDRAPFLEVTALLAGAFAEDGVVGVVADPAEGYNPCHDVCRLVADAAVRRNRRSGADLPTFDTPLAGTGRCPGPVRALELTDAEFAAKRAAANDYPEMAGEVAAAFARDGEAAFRIERFRAVDPFAPPFLFDSEVPFYERHGEARVAAGRYREVLRFQEHVLPLARALAEGDMD